MNMKYAKIAGNATAAAAAGIVGLYFHVFYRSRPSFFEKKHHSDDYYEKRDAAARALDLRPHEILSITSDRGYTLNGFYYRAGRERSKTICYIVHGCRSNHARAAGLYANYYLSQGIDIFCDDHVASGSSGGSFIGYDYLETYDCLKWIDELRKRFGKDVNIILHGFSMGGATVVNMSDKCPDNVKFIVCDSGYTDAETVIGRFFGEKSGLVVKVLNSVNKLFANYDLRNTDVRPAARHTRLPMLFVHGTDDVTVPAEMGRELYGICSSPYKSLLLVPGAGHVESMYRAPDEYTAKLDEYIKEYVG